ncbi:GIY-YIG nuclease family protein [Paenibacillus macerans]|uniref:GIY-YIG nuclease family protein n=1 Tax=Paenibacillus macerans TaxID=44252 RepID=UPI001F11725B|nr:GIY-YIG nuclease family protein [Paenibacillus macerans]MEC0138709.1 GIY-YIG nuclease family protein [Paenibacillus macerans]UMV50560.1 GIY-YIG nuclease family protein [Paenibacillus macerans]
MKDKLGNLPSSPGVYLMKDGNGGILYVGKSKNLQQRVRSYFYPSAPHSNKIKRLVNNVKDLEIRVTDTEFEALMLECRLIREWKPVYNKKMKNPLAYVYIAIRPGNGFRRIEVTHHPGSGEAGEVWFGPYTASKNTVLEAVREIQECLQIACARSSVGQAPCLNYSLGLCRGMCLGGEAVREYERIVDRFIALLAGSDRSIYEVMEQEMAAAAERYDFEAAARYRDSLQAVSLLLDKEKMIQFTVQNRSLAIVEALDDQTFKLFLVKRNRVLFREKYHVADTAAEQLRAEITEAMLGCFGAEKTPPSSALARDEIDEAQIIYGYLQSSACRHLTVPEEWIEARDRLRIASALDNILPRP